MNRLDQAIKDMNGSFCEKSQCYGLVFLPTTEELKSSDGFFLFPGDLFFGHQRNRKIFYQNNAKVSWGRETVAAFLAKIILDGLTPVGVPKADDLALNDPDYYFALAVTEKGNPPDGWHWYVCYDGQWAQKSGYSPAEKVSINHMQDVLKGKGPREPFFFFKIPKNRPDLRALQPIQNHDWGQFGIKAYRAAYKLLSTNRSSASSPHIPSGLTRVGNSLFICSRPDAKSRRADEMTWPVHKTPIGYIPGCEI